MLHLVLTSPDADRCVHCVRDREIEAENAIHDRDQVGRLAETHLASLLPAMSANSVTLKLHDWEEGRGVPSQNEFVSAQMLLDPTRFGYDWIKMLRA